MCSKVVGRVILGGDKFDGEYYAAMGGIGEFSGSANFCGVFFVC